jgi:competence protein CoiA
MLTALNNRKKIVSLTRLSLDEVAMIKGQKFFCPECHSPLTLKAGEIKIPHFAHVSMTRCEGSHEPETVTHLKGKAQLFHHFSSFLPNVTLEHYFRDIQQRTDVFIQLNQRKFAIEYQCTPISSTDFAERTAGYYSAGIEPIWILGKQVKAKGAETLVLSSFQQSFIRYSPHAGYWLSFYNSHSKYIYFYFNLFPLTANIFASNTHSIPLASIPFPFLLPSKDNWQQHKKRFSASQHSWLQNKLKYNRGVNDIFLKSLYLNRDHVVFLPDFIGLPTKHMLLIKSNPIEWQYYLWCDVLKGKKAGEKVQLKDFVNCLKTRLNNGFIVNRKLPLIGGNDINTTLQDYLIILEESDIIKNVGGDEYLLLQAHTK